MFSGKKSLWSTFKLHWPLSLGAYIASDEISWAAMDTRRKWWRCRSDSYKTRWRRLFLFDQQIVQRGKRAKPAAAVDECYITRDRRPQKEGEKERKITPLNLCPQKPAMTSQHFFFLCSNLLTEARTVTLNHFDAYLPASAHRCFFFCAFARQPIASGCINDI